MNTFSKTISFLAVIALLSFLLPVAKADSPYAETLGSNSGFRELATPSLSLASSAATIVGTLPSGAHAVEVYTDLDVNFGPSTVATGTNSPYIPAGTSKTFDKLITANPTIYLRPRTSATATVRLRAW